MAADFLSPKMLIVDYYDSLITDIDIHTEELLEKYDQDDVLPDPKDECEDDDDDESHDNAYNSDTDYDFFENKTMINPYDLKYKQESYQLIKVTPTSTKVRDYLNLVRSKAIEEVNKCREENLNRYEMDKDKYKYNRDDLTDEKVEDMRKELFREKFCFLIKYDNHKISTSKSQCLFKFHTIITDFYISLKKRQKFYDDIRNDRIHIHLNDLLPCSLAKLVYDLCDAQKYGNEIVSFDQDKFLQIGHIDFFIGRNGIDFSTPLSFSLRLAHLKSIEIWCDRENAHYKITNLSLLNNLEYLTIENQAPNQATFDEIRRLNKLIVLKLKYCQDSESFSNLVLSPPASLQILYIDQCLFPVDFTHVTNLKTLLINNLKDVDYLRNVRNTLTEFRITYDLYNHANFYYSCHQTLLSSQFSNLTHLLLEIKYDFSRDWFKELKNLKKLGLITTGKVKQSLNFTQSLCQLEYLDISSCVIEDIKPGTFSKLKKLKHLDISETCYDFGLNRFQGLDNLETLIIQGKINNEDIIILKKGVFKGLKNLRVLDLANNNIVDIDPEVFVDTPKLTYLVIDCDNCKLEAKTFAHLKHLKTIELNRNDPKYWKSLGKLGVEIVVFEI